MKSFITSLTLIATALAASSIPTLRSTTICTLTNCPTSSSVPLAPLSFLYGNVSSFTPLDTTYNVVDVSSSTQLLTAKPTDLTESSTKKVRPTLYVTDIETDNSYDQITRTICSSGGCYVTTEARSSTTYTTTIDGILTVVTTMVDETSSVPTTTASAETTPVLTAVTPTVTSYSLTTETDVLTTVITITSCSDNKCSKVTETTGLTVVTENDTIYTTYCPLSTESKAPEASTATEPSTTVVTITSCSDGKCTESPKTTGVTVITEDNTIYTTYCPLTTESKTPETTKVPETTKTPETSTVTDLSTTVVTITSCSDGKCTERPKTTGVTVITEDNTIYTTYCPLTAESTTTTSSSSSTPPVVSTTIKTSDNELSTVNVITNIIVTESVPPVTLSSTTVPHPSSITISSYDNAAAGSVRATGILTFALSIVFMLI